MSSANQHDNQLWLRIRRTINGLFGDKAKTSPECSATDDRTGLTVHEQIYVGMRSDGTGHSYVYQQRPRHSDPLDQLLLPDGKETKNAKGVKRD